MAHYGYVYITTNNVNGKQYVGQHRGEFDPKYLGSGYILKQSIEKHGLENFRVDILEFCRDEDHLCKREEWWIKELDAVNRDDFYNISPFARGGPLWLGRHHTEETKKKISEANKGRVVSMSTRKKLSEVNIGRTLSKEARKKISEANYKGGHNFGDKKNVKFGPPTKISEKTLAFNVHYVKRKDAYRVQINTEYSFTNGKEKRNMITKFFACKKYGKEEALRLAMKERDKIVHEIWGDEATHYNFTEDGELHPTLIKAREELKNKKQYYGVRFNLQRKKFYYYVAWYDEAGKKHSKMETVFKTAKEAAIAREKALDELQSQGKALKARRNKI